MNGFVSYDERMLKGLDMNMDFLRAIGIPSIVWSVLGIAFIFLVGWVVCQFLWGTDFDDVMDELESTDERFREPGRTVDRIP
jgi:hypothetical protein